MFEAVLVAIDHHQHLAPALCLLQRRDQASADGELGRVGDDDGLWVRDIGGVLHFYPIVTSDLEGLPSVSVRAPDATTAAYAGTVRNSSNVGSVESFSKRALASANLPLVKRASPTSARM